MRTMLVMAIAMMCVPTVATAHKNAQRNIAIVLLFKVMGKAIKYHNVTRVRKFANTAIKKTHLINPSIWVISELTSKGFVKYQIKIHWFENGKNRSVISAIIDKRVIGS